MATLRASGACLTSSNERVFPSTEDSFPGSSMLTSPGVCSHDNRNLQTQYHHQFPLRGDFDGALSLVDEFPSLPPHASSLSAAMQRAMEDGDDGRVESVRVRMREISGERNTDNVMFFGYARVGQIMQTTSILEVCGCGCGCGCGVL